MMDSLHVNVQSADTAQPLIFYSMPCSEIVISVPASNTGEMYIGGRPGEDLPLRPPRYTSSPLGTAGSQAGMVLHPGDRFSVNWVNDTAEIWIASSVADEGVAVLVVY